MANALEEYMNPLETSEDSGVVIGPSGRPRVFVDTTPNKLERKVDPTARATDDIPVVPENLPDALAALRDYLLQTASPGSKFGNRLFGTGGEQRYQTWPEKMIRSGLTLPGEVASGAVSPWAVDPVTGEARTNPTMIERAQDTAGLMGGGAFGATKPGQATLGSGPVRPAAPAVEAAVQAPTFYSAVENAVRSARQPSASAEQWMGFLQNQPGVKPEELGWMGVHNWLSQQKGKVSKEDLQGYLDAHRLELRDVVKNETPDISWSNADPNETRYEQYQLPGAENYREHLLTLPPRGMSPERVAEIKAAEAKTGAAYDRFLRKMIDRDGSGWQSKATPEDLAKFEDLRAKALKASSDLVEATRAPDGQSSYQSSHWDEPNVIAHVRMNDRDVGGKKSLHLEEIQSDWHQEGRKKGYKEGNDDYIYNDNKDVIGSNVGKVPDAPFKTTWPELALKRMIRHAAENGYERVSWTPGEAQAARYDLSKSLDRVEFHKSGTSGFTPQAEVEAGKSGRLVAYDKDGRKVMEQYVDSPEKLADYIGKEAAEKLINQKPSETKNAGLSGNVRKLENADLKVGGEGMIGFYDKMLPKMVEKLGKQHGVKVRQGTIGKAQNVKVRPATDTGGGWEVYNVDTGDILHRTDRKDGALSYAGDYKAQPVWYFDLPETFRDQALGKGFPLFAAGIPFPVMQGQNESPWKKEQR